MDEAEHLPDGAQGQAASREGHMYVLVTTTVLAGVRFCRCARLLLFLLLVSFSWLSRRPAGGPQLPSRLLFPPLLLCLHPGTLMRQMSPFLLSILLYHRHQAPLSFASRHRSDAPSGRLLLSSYPHGLGIQSFPLFLPIPIVTEIHAGTAKLGSSIIRTVAETGGDTLLTAAAPGWHM